MTWSVTTTAGAGATLAEDAKVTSIGGQACEWYIDRLEPYATHGTWRAPILNAVPVILAPLTGLNSSTLLPTYGTPITVLAQVKAEKADRGSDPEHNNIRTTALVKVLKFQNADTAKGFGQITAKLMDSAHGVRLAGLYTVTLQPPPTVTSAGNPKLSIPATTTAATPVSLSAVSVNLAEQWIPEGNARRKLGDARIVIKRDGISLEALMASGAFITVAAAGINSGTARRYQVTGPEGIEPMHTYHWCVYLKRVP